MRQCGNAAMRQCGNAAMRQCGNAAMMEARPCVAGLRRNTRSDCRRAATHGAPSYIAALPHSQIAALPHYRIAKLPHCLIATLLTVLDHAHSHPMDGNWPHASP
jgi:hypothetical protein